MPVPDPNKTRAFKTPEKLHAWLEKNHANETELWVKVFKTHTKKPSVTWGEIVVETLCWGWIDGVRKSIDDDAYVQRISPRRPRSGWSKRNREHAERLIKQGRMREPGLAQVEAAKKDGRWKRAYAPASEMKVPEDFMDAVNKRAKARAFYEGLNKSARYAIAYGLATAKKPETRERRFKKFMDMLMRGEQPGFGFKKKPGRSEVDLFHETLQTPLGPITIEADSHYVLRIVFDWEGTGTRPNAITRSCKRQLKEYFVGKRTDFDVPIKFSGTAFQEKVWKALLPVPYGETATYGEQAKRIRRPKATRAVGAANGRNQHAIVVPCHRVIGADGSLTGYGGGMHRKKWLLEHEQKVAKSRGSRSSGRRD